MLISIFMNKPDRIFVQVPYNPSYIEQLNKISGKVWNADAKLWDLPCNRVTIDALFKILHGEDIHIDNEVLLSSMGAYICEKTKAAEINKGDVVDRAKQNLVLKGMSSRTIKAYIDHIKRFRNYLCVPLEQATPENIYDYVLESMDKDHCSHSYADKL